jgi:hypothetical protein
MGDRDAPMTTTRIAVDGSVRAVGMVKAATVR